MWQQLMRGCNLKQKWELHILYTKLQNIWLIVGVVVRSSTFMWICFVLTHLNRCSHSCFSVKISLCVQAVPQSDRQSVEKKTWHPIIHCFMCSFFYLLACLFCITIYISELTQPQFSEPIHSTAASQWIYTKSNGTDVEGFKKNYKSCFWKREAQFRPTSTCCHIAQIRSGQNYASVTYYCWVYPHSSRGAAQSEVIKTC